MPSYVLEIQKASTSHCGVLSESIHTDSRVFDGASVLFKKSNNYISCHVSHCIAFPLCKLSCGIVTAIGIPGCTSPVQYSDFRY